MTTPPPPMWAHQRAAVEFAAARPGTMIIGWMGTGKSRIVVELAKTTAAKLVFIVCPKAVFVEWPKQWARYHSDAVVLPTCGNKTYVRIAAWLTQLRAWWAAGRNGTRVVLVNYEVIWRDEFIKFFNAVGPHVDLLVFDESHKIKEPRGAASKAATRMAAKARRVVCMTGTPSPNSPLDLFAQYRACAPDVFGPRVGAFKARYAVMGGYQARQIVSWRDRDDMTRRMAPVTFEIPRDVIDLPPEITVQRHCELSEEGRRYYRQMATEMLVDFADGTLTASTALVRLLRLLQMTGGVVRTGDGKEFAVCTAKRALLREVLDECAGEPVVVFCRFTADLDAVHEAAEGDSRELSGRRSELAAWQGGAGRVLAVQVSSGGVGVDLTRARVAVYYSVGYSLGDYLQARARTHRPGQTRAVTHVELVARGTVDEAVYRALAGKSDVADAIMSDLRAALAMS